MQHRGRIPIVSLKRLETLLASKRSWLPADVSLATIIVFFLIEMNRPGLLPCPFPWQDRVVQAAALRLGLGDAGEAEVPASSSALPALERSRCPPEALCRSLSALSWARAIAGAAAAAILAARCWLWRIARS